MVLWATGPLLYQKKYIRVLQSQEFKQGLVGVLDNDSFFSND